MHIEFTDYRRNGEGMTVYSADLRVASEPKYEPTYPEGTEAIFHIGADAAYLNRQDLIDLWVEIAEHLDYDLRG